MKIFVVNCGSSSIKYKLFDMADETVRAEGVLERIGTAEANLQHVADGNEVHRGVDAPDHKAGLGTIMEVLASGEAAVLADASEIDGVGHRVVHGGEKIAEPRLVDDDVLQVIRDNFILGPLHNPANLAGIEGAIEAVPDAVNVAVFDTAFLSTLPPAAYRYAVPNAWYTKHFVRKYGFHGTSHRYVTLRTAELLGKDVAETNLITCHLGNGCSITAITGGRAVDHSMGMTPLEGLMMGTRSGDLDPAVPIYMQDRGLSAKEIETALNKHSGLMGISERSNDMRDLLAAEAEGDAKAALAVEMFVHRLAKYIGSYYVVVPELDAVVLTGGIGENSVKVRWRLLERLARLGVRGDAKRNEEVRSGAEGAISTGDSVLPVWVVPTDEELMIARDTVRIARRA